MAGEAWVVVLSKQGRMKRVPLGEFDVQHRAGKGITGSRPAEGDRLERITLLGTGEDLLVLTTSGRCVGVPWDKVPEMTRYAQGEPVETVLPLETGEGVSAFLRRGADAGAPYLTLATRKGVVKRTEADSLSRLRGSGVRVATLDAGDALAGGVLTRDAGDVFLATSGGKAVRFAESDIRVSGREARGVTGIKLEGNDEVVGAASVEESNLILTVTANGFGKRTPASAYRKTGRGTQGVANAGDAEKVGAVVGAAVVRESDQVLLGTSGGKVLRFPAGEVRETGRDAAGVKLMTLDDGDQVTAMAVLST